MRDEPRKVGRVEGGMDCQGSEWELVDGARWREEVGERTRRRARRAEGELEA